MSEDNRMHAYAITMNGLSQDWFGRGPWKVLQCSDLQQASHIISKLVIIGLAMFHWPSAILHTTQNQIARNKLEPLHANASNARQKKKRLCGLHRRFWPMKTLICICKWLQILWELRLLQQPHPPLPSMMPLLCSTKSSPRIWQSAWSTSPRHLEPSTGGIFRFFLLDLLWSMSFWAWRSLLSRKFRRYFSQHSTSWTTFLLEQYHWRRSLHGFK